MSKWMVLFLCPCMVMACSQLDRKPHTDQINTLSVSQSDLKENGLALVMLRADVKRLMMAGRTETLPATIGFMAKQTGDGSHRQWNAEISELNLTRTNEKTLIATHKIPAGRYILTSVTSKKFLWRGHANDPATKRLAFGEFWVKAGDVRSLGHLTLWVNNFWDFGVRVRSAGRFELNNNATQAKAFLKRHAPALQAHIDTTPLKLTQRATKSDEFKKLIQ